VVKYQSYAKLAEDSQLSQLCTTLAGEEQKHYDTVNQILQGNQPNMGQGQAGQSGQSINQISQQGINLGQTNNSKADKFLCTDLLSTEKYVSGTYDTCIFESPNPAIRQALQHIQKDEQKHGEQIFQYMSSHGMYQVQ